MKAHATQALVNDLFNAMKSTRQESSFVPLGTVTDVMKEVFDAEEIKVIIRNLTIKKDAKEKEPAPLLP